jgi:hypothetical protein
MTRRGKCRCGTILEFEKTSLGYKTRCPQCKAVVRLRPDEPAGAGAAEQPARKKPAALAVPSGPPPLPTTESTFSAELQPGPTLDDLSPAAPPDFSILGDHQTTAPLAQTEMPVYREPEPSSSARWWVFGLAALAVILAVTTAAVLWG